VALLALTRGSAGAEALGLVILGALATMAILLGHPANLRDERRRLELLRPYVGRQVTLTCGARFGPKRTGVFALDPGGRAVHLTQFEGTGILGLPGPPRSYHYRVGDIH